MNDDYENEESEENNVLNDFGEEISLEQITEIARKIRKFDKKQIDDLFFDIGHKEKNTGKNRSLGDKTIQEIKNNQEAAIAALIFLFQESCKDDFLYFVNEKLALKPLEDADESKEDVDA